MIFDTIKEYKDMMILTMGYIVYLSCVPIEYGYLKRTLTGTR